MSGSADFAIVPPKGKMLFVQVSDTVKEDEFSEFNKAQLLQEPQPFAFLYAQTEVPGSKNEDESGPALKKPRVEQPQLVRLSLQELQDTVANALKIQSSVRQTPSSAALD
jgi:hypothetical protein